MERCREHTQADAGCWSRQPLTSPDILKELRGQACDSCGAPDYYLVLCVSARDHEASLAARCRCCHEPKRSLSENRVAQDIEKAARHRLADSVGSRKC